MSRTPAARRFGGAGAALGCLLLGALYSALRGPDASWDLRNYHLYNAWAMLHGRLAVDLAPAGMQSFFNPLADLPYYLLGSGPLQHLPRLLAGVQGLWYGALVFVLLQIARRLAVLGGRRFGAVDLLAVAIGATGTMAVSQTGTTSNELPLAWLLLSGLYLLLPLCGPAPPARPWRRVLLAGLLCGVAAGLKPTAVVYLPALGLGLLLALGARAAAWRMTVLLAAAVLAGFALAYGWWGWRLYQLTGNPVFPLFNQLFHSDWIPAASGTDRQFMPRSLAQWLFYPAFWIVRNARLVTEPAFADPRYAVEQLALLGLLVAAWFGRRTARPGARAERFLLVFVAVGYAGWLLLFSILRYAVPLEALSGVLPMLALQSVPASRQPDGLPRRWVTWAMAALFVLVAGFSRYPGWGHGGYGARAFDVEAPAIAPGSLVLVVGQPQAYVIPFLPRAADSRYVGLTWFNRQAAGHRFETLVRERIARRRGPLFALMREDSDGLLDLLRQVLPRAHLDACMPVRSGLERAASANDPRAGLRLCAVLRD